MLKDLVYLYLTAHKDRSSGDLFRTYEDIRDSFHYNLSLDETIVKAKSVYLFLFPNAREPEFIDWFLSSFKNKWLTEFRSDEVRWQNERVHMAYLSILDEIRRIQSRVTEEWLRKKIEISWENIPSEYTAINQTVTLFCQVSLSCNQRGEYYINYAIAEKCHELIGDFLTNKLLSRIPGTTEACREPFLVMDSPFSDQAHVFDDLLRRSRTEDHIRAFKLPQISH